MSTTVEKHKPIVTEVTHLRKVGHSLGLTIPKHVLAALAWPAGQALLIQVEGNRMVLESLVEHMAAAVRQHEQQTTTN